MAGSPITDAELVAAYRADALFDAHRDNPEFGYRFLLDEARAGGEAMAERTAWWICRDNRWWSAFGKRRRGKGRPPGAPGHDDLVRREFTADAPNRIWLSDVTEYKTAEGKLYLGAINDVFLNRIVGYSISDRMKARLAIDAVNSAVARRGNVAGCVLRTDRGSQFRVRKMVRALHHHGMVGYMGSVGAQAITRPWNPSLACCRITSTTGAPGTFGTSSASPSSPGSSPPTTDAADRSGSEV